MPIYELNGQGPEFPSDGSHWIAETAVLIARVRMKSMTSIWFGAVLRGDNEWIELGARSQIQENATLHTDMGFPLTIGEDCVIGHNVMLHGCIIGNNSLIGMSAIVLNGARIGNNSLIVGSPARAIRTLTPEAIAQIRHGADHYDQRSREYAEKLKRIG